jgi:hypothetical protein
MHKDCVYKTANLLQLLVSQTAPLLLKRNAHIEGLRSGWHSRDAPLATLVGKYYKFELTLLGVFFFDLKEVTFPRAELI